MPMENLNDPAGFPGGGVSQQGGLFNPYEQALSLQLGQPPIPPPQRIPSPKPTKAQQDAAFDFFSDWCKQAQDYTDTKLSMWKLLEDLYESRRPLSTWDISLGKLAYEKQKVLESWRTNLVIPHVTTVVNSGVDRALRTIFFSDEYFQIQPMPKPGKSSVEDAQFATSKKFTYLMREDFEHAHLQTHITVALRYLFLFGWTIMKAGWFTREVPVWEEDYFGRQVKTMDTVYQCPSVRAIKPHRVLVDWNATDMNLQSWQAIGHKADISYYTALDRFNQGTWNLGKSEFLDRWEKDVDQSYYTDEADDTPIFEDQDLPKSEETKVHGLKVWEVHGRYPYKKKWVESVASIVTDRNAEDPKGGVLVRLQEGTALDCGLRPFAGALFCPTGTVFGKGSAEPHLPLVKYISTLMAIEADAAKQTVQGMWGVRTGSAVHLMLQEENESDIATPGKWWPVNRPDDLRGIDRPQIDSATLAQVIRQQQNYLERLSNTFDSTLGINQREKTAMETSVLMEAGNTPLHNIVKLFAQTGLNPMGLLCVALWQQFEMNDRQIVIETDDNQQQVVTITQEEIRSGAYRVRFILDMQDQMRTVKFQALTQAIPLMQQIEPQMNMQGKEIRWDVVVNRGLELLGMDRVGEFIRQVPPEVMQQRMMMQAMPQGGGPPGLPPSGGPPAPFQGGPRGQVDDLDMALQQLQEAGRQPMQPIRRPNG